MDNIQNLQAQGAAAGENPVASQPLERQHDDLDILAGCPRKLKIGKHTIVSKAFLNDEYDNLARIILLLGFVTCKSEAEVDAMTLEDIYNNIVFQSNNLGDLNVGSFSEFLYSLMKFENEEKPPFGEVEIARNQYMQFLGNLIEQNNMMKYARIHAKKNLETMAQLQAILARRESGNPDFSQ